MSLESELRKETEKWTKRIENEMKKIKSPDKKHQHFLTNINAYVKDSKHFLEKGDPIRSFEAIVWAWSWVEILKELGILKG